MRPRSIVIVVVLLCAGLFALLNWTAFAATTRVNLVFRQVEAPLGVIMLSFVVLLSLVYLGLLARIEGAELRERRRLGRELERLRKLAEGEEDARFRELGNRLSVEFESLHASLDELKARPAGTDSTKPEGPS